MEAKPPESGDPAPASRWRRCSPGNLEYIQRPISPKKYLVPTAQPYRPDRSDITSHETQQMSAKIEISS